MDNIYGDLEFMYIDIVLQETSWETILVSDHWILSLVRGDRLREVRLYLLITIKWLKKENIFWNFTSIHSIFKKNLFKPQPFMYGCL